MEKLIVCSCAANDPYSQSSAYLLEHELDTVKAGVKKYELPWKHVYQPRSGAVNTLDLYGVTGFPTKILVGPDGKIVKTIVGEDPAFYTFLDEKFGKK